MTQEDVLLGTLTVRETLSYSAHLRLPSSMSKSQIREVVEGTIMEMGLQECADRQIGNWQMRGISGGEKKRVSIALEILTRPSLMFLDEPTSGLDSAAAFFVIQSIKNLARDGRTIISSIHQPSSEVFALFDDLYLLSGGDTVYFGEAKTGIQVLSPFFIFLIYIKTNTISPFSFIFSVFCRIRISLSQQAKSLRSFPALHQLRLRHCHHHTQRLTETPCMDILIRMLFGCV